MDTGAEFRAYENLSAEYHSLGDLEKARHFHERVVKGWSVVEHSSEHKACMAAV
jgi:hypothetical protein